MKTGKFIAAVLFLSMAVSASGQDLAAAAKKEKERREALKNKPAVTVNNGDLSKVKKKASVELPPQTDVPTPPVEGEGAPPAAAPKPSAVAAEPGKGVNVAEEAADAEVRRAELQDKYERAKKDLELYSLKMRALQQQFYSFNTMQSKAQVQQEISDTNAKLLAATAEEAALKKQLDEFNAKNPIKK